MNWRPLRTNELDHERLWLVVSLAAAAAGGAWLAADLPLPACTFRAVTGCPCPTCGTTRAVLQLGRGHVGAAFRFNPLAVGCVAAVIGFDLYAATVLALRLPRLRLDGLSPRAAFRWRVAVCGAVVLNWAWLISSGV